MSTHTKTQIVSQLAALGYSQSDVSVRSEGYSSFILTIRKPHVMYSEVEKVAHENAHVHRCEFSGDILSGGNTFVNVRLSDEVWQAWTGKYAEAVDMAFAKVKANHEAGNSYGAQIDDRFTMHPSQHGPSVIQVFDKDENGWLRHDYHTSDLKYLCVDLYKLTQVKEKPVIAPVPDNNVQVIIGHNKDKNGIEIKFAHKPDASVLDALKSNGYRWGKFNKCWYCRVSHKAIEVAKQFGTVPNSLLDVCQN